MQPASPLPASLEPGDSLPGFLLKDPLVRPVGMPRDLSGKAVVLLFFPSYWSPGVQQILKGFAEVGAALAERADLYAITGDSLERNASAAAACQVPITFLSDADGRVTELYGLPRPTAAQPAVFGVSHVSSFVADSNARLLASHRQIEENDHAAKLLALLNDQHGVAQEMRGFAPVLMVPRAFSPAFCKTLIESYETGETRVTGSLRDYPDGRQVHHIDRSIKSRRDHILEGALAEEVRQFLRRRVVPEIHKAFSFQVTHFEPFKVACYTATEGGHFSVHRDNLTPAGAHRRFAMSLNLNSEDYQGGTLRFPEYGPGHYKPATGEAVVFSCSLLHEAMPVTEGTRYVLLSFLYGPEDEKLRLAGKRQRETRVVGR